LHTVLQRHTQGSPFSPELLPLLLSFLLRWSFDVEFLLKLSELLLFVWLELLLLLLLLLALCDF